MGTAVPPKWLAGQVGWLDTSSELPQCWMQCCMFLRLLPMDFPQSNLRCTICNTTSNQVRMKCIEIPWNTSRTDCKAWNQIYKSRPERTAFLGPNGLNVDPVTSSVVVGSPLLPPVYMAWRGLRTLEESRARKSTDWFYGIATCKVSFFLDVKLFIIKSWEKDHWRSVN